MVRISPQGNRAYATQNTKREVPLGRGVRASYQTMLPRFRPGDRFNELGFRYLSLGREGEKYWPLAHMRQIPFIHFTARSNFYI